jgi:predicted DsbA family dithiol-disulfide isomerase
VSQQVQPAIDQHGLRERSSVRAMEIEAYVDLACPRSYVGVRHLSDALASFKHQADVVVVWRSFHLDPLMGHSLALAS